MAGTSKFAHQRNHISLVAAVDLAQQCLRFGRGQQHELVGFHAEKLAAGRRAPALGRRAYRRKLALALIEC